MGLKIEYRLECDYCGVQSPLIPHMSVSGYIPAKPWVKDAVPYLNHYFCCEAHHSAWQATRTALVEQGS